MIRRFFQIFVPRWITNCLVLHASLSPRGKDRTPRRRGFLAFTVPSLAVPFAPAASPFIVHLSCFTPLKQQSPLTRRDYSSNGTTRELGCSPRRSPLFIGLPESEKSPIYLFICLGTRQRIDRGRQKATTPPFRRYVYPANPE